MVPCFETECYLTACLRGLEAQRFTEFDVIIIHKPSSPRNSRELESAVGQSRLRIRVVPQAEGMIEEAMQLGIQLATYEIVIFLDSDAVPGPDFVGSHVTCYDDPKVGGTSGSVVEIPESVILQGQPTEVEEVCNSSNHLSEQTELGGLRRLLALPRTLPQFRGYSRTITRSGFEYQTHDNLRDKERVSLGPGANMSVRGSAVRGLVISPRTLYGIRNEAQIGLQLRLRSWELVFAKNAVIFHARRKESLSRGRNPTKQLLTALESTTFVNYLAWKGCIQRPTLALVCEAAMLTVGWRAIQRNLSVLIWGMVGAIIGMALVTFGKRDQLINCRKTEERLLQLFS